MATLYITEYETIGHNNRSEVIMCPKEPAIAEQTVSIGAASVPSSPFNARTKFVRIHTDTICSIKFGAAGQVPVATTSSGRMGADQVEFRSVDAGARVSVITNT